VVTGIDHVGAAMSAPGALDARLAELRQKLRPNSQRPVERAESGTRPPLSYPEASPADPHARPAASKPAAGQLAPTAPAAPPAATLPPATAIEDVIIRPLPTKPSLFLEPADDERLPAEPPHDGYIPPLPERPMRQPRMPRLEDLPIPAQNEIRASRGEIRAPNPEKRRTSLLQRLASVGLGRREEEAEPPPQARPAPRPAPQGAPRMAPPARPEGGRGHDPRAPEARGHDPVSEYAKRSAPVRPAPQGLDAHGRASPVHNSIDDDHLEIPAFLRRQAN